MARWPKHRPTEEMRRQVAVMIGMGLRQSDVSKLVRLDPKTLRKHYQHELETGQAEANLRVAQSLFQMATKEHVPSAAIFWLKARAGWKDGLLAQVNAQIDASVTVGGIDRPPRESLQQWLERRRRELNALDGPPPQEHAQPPSPQPPNGEAPAQAEPPQAREAKRRGAADSAAGSAGPATRSMTPQEADWLAIRRRELGIEPDDVRPNPAVKR